MTISQNKNINDFKFSHIENFDISNIKDIVLKMSDEWLLDTSRQNNGDMFKDTYSYMIQRVALDWTIGKSLIKIPLSYKNNIEKEIVPIIKDLESNLKGTAGQIFLTKIPKGKSIPEHNSHGEYLKLASRHYISIVTSDKSTISVDDKKIHILDGECWEINNNLTNSFCNMFGNQDQVYLVIDIISNKFFRFNSEWIG
jgi:hypothetical protein